MAICLDFDWQTNEFMLYCRTTQLREKTMLSYEQTLRLFEKWCKEEQGISTVDSTREREFIRLPLSLYLSVHLSNAFDILGFIAKFVQTVKIGTDRFLLHGDFEVVVKVIDDFLNLYRMGFIRIFQKIVQKVEQFKPLILRSALAFFAVRHSVPSCGGFSVSIAYRKEREKNFFKVLINHRIYLKIQ